MFQVYYIPNYYLLQQVLRLSKKHLHCLRFVLLKYLSCLHRMFQVYYIPNYYLLQQVLHLSKKHLYQPRFVSQKHLTYLRLLFQVYYTQNCLLYHQNPQECQNVQRQKGKRTKWLVIIKILNKRITIQILKRGFT